MDTEKTIFFRIKKLARLLDRLMDQTRANVSEQIDGVDNVSPIQGRIVIYVFAESGKKKNVHQKDIETYFDIRSSTAAIILKRMEKNGLITRETSDVDVRMKVVKLTQKARDMCPSAQEEAEKAESRLTAGLTEQELAIFIKALEKVTRNIS